MDAAFSTIELLCTEDAPQVVIADRRVPITKYSSIVSTSTGIAKKHPVSHKDKNFESLDMRDKALRASNLLSLVDRSRKRPAKTASNQSGDVDEAVVDTMDADGLSSYVVIAVDDCYKCIAFTFMVPMIDQDMHHMLLEPIRKEDPVKIYRTIEEHFKGDKNHHVEAARNKLNAHRLGRGLSKLLELISDLEVAQIMEMSESQKFRILRILMQHEKHVHVKNVVGIASYNRENFNFTIRKIK